MTERALFKLSSKQVVSGIILISIVLSVVFGRTSTGQARIAVYATYLCIGTCFLYSLSKRMMKINYFHKLLLIFGLIISLSALYSPTNNAIVTAYLIRFWISFLFSVLISNVIENKQDINLVINACFLAGVFFSIYVYIYYGVDYLLKLTFRIDDTLGNQNEIGMYCAFSILFGIYEIFHQRKPGYTILYSIGIVLCIPVLMITGSRKAILIAAISVLVLVLSYSKTKGRFRRLLFITAIISVILFFGQEFVYLSGGIVDRFSDLGQLLSGGDVTRNDATRLYFIKEGWNHFLNSPIFGNGFLSSYAFFNMYAHNNYIEILMDNGLIGFCVFYSIHLKTISKAINEKDNYRDSFSFVCVCMAALALVDVGVVSFYNSFVLIVIMLCVKQCELCASDPEQSHTASRAGV